MPAPDGGRRRRRARYRLAVVLNVGLESGILPPPLFTMLTLMALMTTAMTSPLWRRLGYPNRRAAEAASSAAADAER